LFSTFLFHFLFVDVSYYLLIVVLQDLLLLIVLTQSNTNIQKIVAFENAFERLFDIIRDEGNSDGGQFVCLLYI